MSTLHIINHSLDPAGIASLQRTLQLQDGVLLCGDAVYLAVRPDFPDLALPVFALACDVQARGLRAQWPDYVRQIDHAQYVGLCVHHAKSLSWN